MDSRIIGSSSTRRILRVRAAAPGAGAWAGTGLAPGCRQPGSRRWMVVPRPGALWISTEPPWAFMVP